MSISCFLGLSMMDYYEEEATITKQEKVDSAVSIYALSIHDLGLFCQTLNNFPVGNLSPKRK